MKSVTLKDTKTIIGRIPPDQDLLEALHNLCKERGIRTGYIKGIGAVRKAVIGYYDQVQQKYVENHIDRPMEIVSLMANVSLKDETPFVHAHIALGDRDGRVYGGHLLPGTTTFVFEYILTTGEGTIERKWVDQLGLYLWETE